MWNSIKLQSVLAEVLDERARQIQLWGNRAQTDYKWLMLLQEELGEAAQAINQGKETEANMELVQCAALMLAWLESRKIP